MEIFLTNTLTRKKEKFIPLNKKEVRMYTCGPTVYRDIHIGNLRTYLMADILKRVLIYNDHKVKHIKNITDVGHMRTDEQSQNQIDPIIAEALKQGKTPQQIAEEYTKQFLQDEKRLNILPADVFPKATEHIKEMIEITKALLEKGYAYEADGTVLDAEGGAKRGKAGIRGEAEHGNFGAVYFDVKKFKKYGQLSGNTLAKMNKLLEAVRVSSETDKKDSIDFGLWKKAEKSRDMKWPSPWGEGFPGWHIECSAMALKLLGNAFEKDKFYPEPLDSARGKISRTIDIHTGGEDNIFPHHEDEIAQSEAATGKKFVNYWIHGGFLLVDGEKMAKRKGNVYLVSTIEERGFRSLAFRYLALTTHYRSRLNFTWKSLEAAQVALNNLYREVSGYALQSNPKIGCAEYEQNFLKAVNEDLDTPKALSIVWDLVDSSYPPSAKLESLYKFDQVLGLDLEKVATKAKEVPDEVKKLVEQREEARKKGDFKKSDDLREQIREKGYEVVDTATGQRLKRIINS